MKKTKILLLFFISILLVPNIVQAYQIECDLGTFDYLDNFYCRIIGYKDKNYASITGSVAKNENITCIVSAVGDGLENTSTDNTALALTGTTTGTIVATYRCQVTKKIATENQYTQFLIDNFSYQEVGATAPSKEILRSDNISLKKYIEPTTTVTTKPRNTSNGNSLLEYIQSSNLELTFSRFITEYNVEVLYEIDTADLKYAPVNKDANVRVVGSRALKVGDNVIDIYVTSPDKKSTTCYTINIKRLARGEEIYYPESDATLASLTLPGYAINFEKAIYDYSIYITRDVTSVEVNAVATHENAVVDISGNTNLENGSIITVLVTSEDGNNEQKYKIKVSKEAPKKDYTPYIILGVLSLLVIVVIIIIIKTSQKRKKDPLLRIKTDKRKVNKGNKLNMADVPETTTSMPNNNNQVVDLTKNTIEPITATSTDKPVLNDASTTMETLDLSVPPQAEPIPVTEDKKEEGEFLELDE